MEGGGGGKGEGKKGEKIDQVVMTGVCVRERKTALCSL